jgi:HSP20 family molecular chaperone IbpA
VTRKIRTIRLRRLEGQIGEVAYQFTKIHFSHFRQPDVTWRPAANVFECSSCFRICLEVAGVDHDQIEIEIEPRQLRVRGQRSAPEPKRSLETVQGAPKAIRVLAMEIDYGLFEREFDIPSKFDMNRITTEWTNGLLWILLPLRAQA